MATNFGKAWSSSKAVETKIYLYLHLINYLLLAFLPEGTGEQKKKKGRKKKRKNKKMKGLGGE